MKNDYQASLGLDMIIYIMKNSYYQASLGLDMIIKVIENDYCSYREQ